MNRRQTGAAYERCAGEYLRTQGYELIAYNFRCRQGEIDIIARDGRYLVFVEVKYRKNGQSGVGWRRWTGRSSCRHQQKRRNVTA